MVWVLLIVIAGSNSGTVDHIEFVGLETCQKAREQVVRQLEDDMSWRTVVAMCLNKGEVR